ncbi:MAG: TonB-dependent receptor [Bacteroidota bacterium]
MKYLFFLFFLIASILSAQINTIHGRVIDDEDNALHLANVYDPVKNIGVVTDINGYFTLKAEFTTEDKLNISYIGYETKTVSLASFSDEKIIEIILAKKILSSQTVLVKALIGREGEQPITSSKIGRSEIESRYTNQDIPEILSYLPSTTFYSEGGAGIGYNYLSIRGFDQRRISVTINGIPQNDPEDHNVYWVDFPDLLESTEMIQVQRGAGSGVIGYPSVGGSINIITSSFSYSKKVELSSSAGSYNTRKYAAVVSSGLIENKYSIYAKFSQTLSNGYRDGNWIDFKAYHLSAVRYDDKLTTQINLFGGPIADGLVYTGLPKFAVNNKTLRKRNYSYWEADNKQITYASVRLKEEIENFSQPHYELLNEYKLNDQIVLNSALFLVTGDGFFDYDGSWAPYSYFRITPENGFNVNGDPDDLYFPNLLIRATVENRQWGWIPRVSYKHKYGELIFGGEFRVHRSNHYGNINHGADLPAGVSKDYEYYRYKGAKDIYNFFVHENYNLTERLNLLAEFQIAYHKYRLYDEKFVGTDFNVEGLFFNPKVGLNYKITENINSYVSFARVTREPRLKNYYDAAEASDGFTLPQFETDQSGNYNFSKPLVQPETMNGFELGTNYADKKFNVSVNGFYMFFTNEIVKQGQLDRFGQPVTGNIDETIHTGLELSGAVKLNEQFTLNLNGSYSKNYVSNGYYYLNNTEKINLTNNSIGGFPELTFNGILTYDDAGLNLQLLAKYVGDLYSDNYDENLKAYSAAYPGFVNYTDNKLDAYFVLNFIGSYQFNAQPYFNNVKIFIQANNIFDSMYAAYAIGKEFFPAAERHFLTGMRIGL